MSILSAEAGFTRLEKDVRDDGILEIKENSSGSIVPDSPGGSAVDGFLGKTRTGTGGNSGKAGDFGG